MIGQPSAAEGGGGPLGVYYKARASAPLLGRTPRRPVARKAQPSARLSVTGKCFAHVRPHAAASRSSAPPLTLSALLPLRRRGRASSARQFPHARAPCRVSRSPPRTSNFFARASPASRACPRGAGYPHPARSLRPARPLGTSAVSTIFAASRNSWRSLVASVALLITAAAG